MPHASTFTRTCPLAGLGISRSTNSQSPPGFPTCAAFILLFIYLVLVCLLNRFVWQEARRELFHRAESVCEKRYRIVVRERTGVVGSTSRLHRRGNAGAVTSRSPRRKQLRQRRKGRFHSRFLA